MLNFIFLASGLILLLSGSEFLIKYSGKLANSLGVSQFVIAFVLISFGTSLPELASSIFGMINGFPDLVVGGLIGSNITNILLVISIYIIIVPIKKFNQNINFQNMSSFLMSIIFSLLCIIGTKFNFIFGIIFIFILMYIIQNELKSNTLKIVKNFKDQTYSISKSILIIIFSITSIIYGSKLFINSSINLATTLGVSEALIGITLVAIGTSMPELIVSIIAAIKRNNEFVLGNILGSNIYNILGIFGISTFFETISIPLRIEKFDIYTFLISAAFLSVTILVCKKLPRMFGIIGLLSYFVYLNYIIIF